MLPLLLFLLRLLQKRLFSGLKTQVSQVVKQFKKICEDVDTGKVLVDLFLNGFELGYLGDESVNVGSFDDGLDGVEVEQVKAHFVDFPERHVKKGRHDLYYFC